MGEQAIPPHVPVSHPAHRNPCGCQTDLTKGAIVCECGAAYERGEVETFPRWVCYDCGTAWVTPAYAAMAKPKPKSYEEIRAMMIERYGNEFPFAVEPQKESHDQAR